MGCVVIVGILAPLCVSVVVCETELCWAGKGPCPGEERGHRAQSIRERQTQRTG